MELSAVTGASAMMVGSGAFAQSSGDTIRIAFATSRPASQDPAASIDLPPMIGPDHWANEQMFDQLARPTDGQFGVEEEDFVPLVAESWSHSEDLRTWVFQIRQGIPFHKGYGTVSVEDVVFSFNRAREGGAYVNVANIADIQVTGEYEVTFLLTDPDALFLGNSVFAINTGIISKRAFEEMGAEAFATSPIGSGPYEMVSVSLEDGLRMKRFEDYFDPQGMARTENIHMQYIADPTARTLALLGGQVDMIEGVRSPGWVQQIQSRDPNLIFDMTQPGSFLTLHFNLNRAPFDDIRVRRAVAHAINRNDFQDSFAPLSGPLYTLNPPQFPAGFDQTTLPEDIRYEYDLDKARELLAEAGHPNGFSFTQNVTQREDYSSIMLIIQEQLRAVGINMDLQIIDHTAYHDSIRHDEGTMVLYALSYPPIPTRAYLDYVSSAADVKPDRSGGLNFSHYGVAMPGIDDLLVAAREAESFEEYISLCEQIALQVQRDIPSMGITTLSSTMVRSPRVDLGYELESGYTWWRLDKASASG